MFENAQLDNSISLCIPSSQITGTNQTGCKYVLTNMRQNIINRSISNLHGPFKKRQKLNEITQPQTGGIVYRMPHAFNCILSLITLTVFSYISPGFTNHDLEIILSKL